MGVAALHDIFQGLLDEGMDPEMPAAILQKGTTAGQKKIVATVSTLEAEVKRQGIQTPAIIVVGKVCALADEFNWYEKLPLMGWKVLVTRPKNRSSRTTELLREKGAEVLELPSIRTQALEDQMCIRDRSRYEAKICVLEKEEDVCCGTSKANSAIVHAGYDAAEGSLKAKLNVRGNLMMEELSEKLDFPFKRNGSLVILSLIHI